MQKYSFSKKTNLNSILFSNKIPYFAVYKTHNFPYKIFPKTTLSSMLISAGKDVSFLRLNDIKKKKF